MAKNQLPSLFYSIGAPPKRHGNKDLEKQKVDGILDCKVERNTKGQFLVRGRIFDATKPQTFNQPWTPEEQRRFEYFEFQIILPRKSVCPFADLVIFMSLETI